MRDYNILTLLWVKRLIDQTMASKYDTMFLDGQLEAIKDMRSQKLQAHDVKVKNMSHAILKLER